MNLSEIITLVRSHTRDFNETIFRREDIVRFSNQALDRFIEVIPKFDNIPYLVNNEDEVAIIPRQYQYLIAIFATARLFAQDERHYEAATFMNEFESKLAEFQTKLEAGEIKIIDPTTGEEIDTNLDVDFVKNDYYY